MERIAPWQQSHWDWRAAGNFILGGSGSGLAIGAALAAAAGYVSSPLASLVAGLCVAAGLGLVWLEIGRPWRFLHVFFHPATSWMTREAIIAPFLLTSLLAAAWWTGIGLSLLAGLFGAAFLYAQARIFKESKGIPAWRDPRIVPLIVATGLCEGSTVLLLFATLAGGPVIPVAILALVFVLLRGAAWLSYCKRFQRQSAPTDTRKALEQISRPFMLAGFAAPALLLLLTFALPAGVASVIAALLALGGGWVVKHTIVIRAGFNQGFALPHLPVYGKLRSGASSKPGWS